MMPDKDTLSAREIDDQAEISKWLKWIYDLPNSTLDQHRFRSEALKAFNEAMPPNYTGAPGNTYHLIYYKETLEQLLVKVNWEATPSTINLGGMVRIKKGEKAHICLKCLIDAIRPVCEKKKKLEIVARSSSDAGQYVLEKLSLLVETKNDDRAFRIKL